MNGRFVSAWTVDNSIASVCKVERCSSGCGDGDGWMQPLRQISVMIAHTPIHPRREGFALIAGYKKIRCYKAFIPRVASLGIVA